MSVDNYVAICSAVISLVGLLFVALQLRDSNDQRKLDSVLQIYGINREIIAFGFINPDLFKVLHGQTADPLVERHYLQLWFNHFALIQNFKDRKFFPIDLRESLERDIRYFMEEENARRHWHQNREYYPPAFQAYIDSLTPPKADAPNERPPEDGNLN